MNSNRHALISLCAALAFSVPAHSAKSPASLSPKAAALKADAEFAKIDFNSPEFTQFGAFDAKFAEELAKKHAKRKPASRTQYSESDLTPDFKAFRTKFLNVKTDDELQALLDESRADYDKYSPALKYFVSQMQLLRPLRGVVWRMRPLFETGRYFSGNKATHSAAVSAIRTVGHLQKIFFPTEQWTAGFNFITRPSSTMSTADQFPTMAHFQNFLATDVINALTRASNEIQIIYSMTQNIAFVWDNKINFGTGAFDDGIRRYVGHGVAEVTATLGTLQWAMHDVMMFCAYDQSRLMDLIGKMGKLHGIDGYSSGDLGMTGQERVAAIKSFDNNGPFWRLRRNQEGDAPGRQAMQNAYAYLRSGVSYLHFAYERLREKDGSPDARAALNPLFFSEDAQPNLDEGIKSLVDAVNGVKSFRSPITGETVSLNLPAFFTNPAPSLFAFLPTDFQGGESDFTIRATNGQNLSYRNYDKGRAIAWNNTVWANYVPSAAGKPAGYMIDAQRHLRMSFGAAPVIGPMQFFLR